MGFQNGCVCARCTDRQARARCFHSEGLPNADTRAKQESEEFFRTPWLFRFDSDAGFPRPLKESDA